MSQIILLPYPSFRESVACYSNNVLAQTLRMMLIDYECLDKKRYNIDWGQKGTWLLWSRWKQAYIRLGMMCVEEAKLRNIPYDRKKATCLFQAKRNKHWRKPLWIGWKRLYSDHRAALLQIGEIERISYRIIRWKKLENAPNEVQIKCVNDWFDLHGFTGLFEGDEAYNNEIHDILTIQGAPLFNIPNYYDRYNWTERPCGNISAWPPEPGDSWICRV